MKNQIKKNRLIILSVFVLLILQTPLSIFAQNKEDKIDQLMNKYFEYEQFNGTVLVAEKSEIIYKNGFGLANMEWNIPNKPDIKFRLGSITKQFTSVLIMQLVEEGKIKLDEKMSKYIPDYPKKIADKVTIHHLLTHTSGIPSYTNFPNFFQETSRDPYTPDEFIKLFSNKDFEFEPGSQYRYNNSGYFLLGVIIEKVTGKTYEKTLQNRILEPLDLKGTGYDHHDVILERRAAAYEKGPNGFINAPYLDMSLPYAAGSLYSTVEDLYKWDQALYTEKLITNKSKKMMFTPFLNGYAYGWAIQKQKISDSMDSISVVAHGGGINGFNTLITRIVNDKHLVVLLNNTGGTNLGQMSNNIVKILYNQKYDLPKMPFVLLLQKAKTEKEVKDAIDKYQKSKDEYSINENQINNLGYQYLEAQKIQSAIHVFKLNIESFSKSANVYDSMGEAYLESGDKEKSVEFYKKALEINPRLESAKNMLKKLGVAVDESLGREITVSPEILKKYVGKYEIREGFILSVTLENNQLMTQATGQQKFEIFPTTKTKYFVKDFEAQLEFSVKENGIPESVTLFQGGREIVAKRIE